MKKYLKKILLFIITLLSVTLFACDCGGEEEEVVVPNIQLDYYAYTMDILDDFTFNPKTNVESTEIQWSSSNEAVATVTNGKVTAVSAGETVITATVGEISKKCYITVEDKQMLPTLSTNAYLNQLKLLKTDSYTVTPTLKYNDKIVDGVNYAFEIEDTNIATVSADGVVTAKNVGSTVLKIVTDWKSSVVSVENRTQYLDVIVIEEISVKFSTSQITLYANSNLVEETDTKANLTYKVLVGGVETDAHEVDLVIDNPEVCSYDEASGILTADKAGKTLVTASTTVDNVVYTGITEVEVLHAVETKTEKVYVGKNSINVDYFFGDSAPVTHITTEVGGNLATVEVENNIARNMSVFEIGNTSMTVYNDYYAYEYTDVEVVDLFVTCPAEVEILRNNNFDYCLLGCDIDMTNNPLTTQGSAFYGTFDGNGYTIKNLQYNAVNVSLFFRLYGTVKNLVLQNVSLATGVQSGAISIHMYGGTIDNVYAGVNLSLSNHSGGFVKDTDTNSNNTIKNSVINVLSTMGNNCGLFIGFGAASSTLTIENSYAVKPSASATLVGGRGDAYAPFRDTVNALDTSASPVSFNLADFLDEATGGRIDVNKDACEKIGLKDTRTTISTADEFAAALVSASRYENFVLTADIDMNDLTGGNKELVGIATYSGTFNGNGHTISNLIIAHGDRSYGTGLFRNLTGGTVKKLALTNVTFGSSITANTINTGVIAGYAQANSKIDNVFVSVNASNVNNNFGVLVGAVKSVSVTNCVINVTADNANELHGSLYGKIYSDTSATPTGTYVITNLASDDNIGDVNSQTTVKSTINTALASNVYTSVADFKVANIDFSGYNAAVSGNVAELN